MESDDREMIPDIFSTEGSKLLTPNTQRSHPTTSISPILSTSEPLFDMGNSVDLDPVYTPSKGCSNVKVTGI